MIGSLEKLANLERTFERKIKSSQSLQTPINNGYSDEFLPKLSERRRRTSSCSTSSSNDGLPSAVIVVRQNSLPSDVSSNPSSLGSHTHSLIGAEWADLVSQWIDDPSLLAIPIDNPDLGYAQLLQTHSCYDVMPQSSKMLVFDTQLPIRKAFCALANSHCRYGLLFDSKQCKMVGIMSVTDFMRLLLRFHTIWKDKTTFESGCDGLIELPIAQSLELLERDQVLRPFTSIDSTESLLSGAQKLSLSPGHGLPVLDPQTGNPLFILSPGQLLHFLYHNAQQLPKPSFMSETPKSLLVGTWTNLHVVNAETPLMRCIERLFSAKVGALPIVNCGHVMDIFSRFDAVQLLAENKFEVLHVNVQTALKSLTERNRQVVSCLHSDTLSTIVTALIEKNVRRLMVLSTDGKLQGIITVSDVIKSLVLHPVETYDADLLHDANGHSNGDHRALLRMGSIPEETMDHMFHVGP